MGKRREPPAPQPGEPAAKRRKQAQNPNADICSFLHELADYEKNVSGVLFKSNVYRKAASALAKLDHRVTSGSEVGATHAPV